MKEEIKNAFKALTRIAEALEKIAEILEQLRIGRK